MPQQFNGLDVGTTIRKNWNGVDHVVEVTQYGFTYNGRTYSSLSAAAKAVRGDNAPVSGWSWFGIVNPLARVVTRTTTTTTVRVTELPKGKCQHKGCYEPADCKHGMCHIHCNQHRIGSYSSRSMPRCAAPHVGVEIEVVYGSDETLRRGAGLDNAHADGSLGSLGAEYKLLGKAHEICGMASELVQEVWKRGARVNRHCGLHVHLDARSVSYARRNEVMSWLQRTQETWFSLVPPSRRNNQYCQRITNPSHTVHYTWANYTSYNTLEIRLHGGTLNPFKLIGWLTALTHLQAKINDPSFVFPAGQDDFWAVFNDCPDAGKEYIQSRIDNGGILTDRAFRAVEE